MKSLSLLILFLFPLSSLAQSREEMIQYFLEFEDVETRATDIMEGLRDELVASDKKITNANFIEIFGTVFEDYRDAYIIANEKAYSVYSDQEIKQLYDFYTSDFGQWYRLQEEEFGPRVREHMEEPREMLSVGISNGFRKKRKSRKK
jgi:hypothetical protein